MVERDLERLVEILSKKLFGKYRGVVKDNVDPQKRGRLLVEVKTAFGQEKVWALPCVPSANLDGSGLYSMPDKEALVFIEFEAGEKNFPIWTGCFWPEKAIDPADAQPSVKFWRTKNFVIRIDDEKGELLIEKKDGGKLKITGTEVSVEANSVVQTSGGNQTTLSQSSYDVLNGAMTVV